MAEQTWFGKRCFCCNKRFWSGGGVVRIVHAELRETGEEYDEKPICEPCAREMDRAAEVGKAMRTAIDGEGGGG